MERAVVSVVQSTFRDLLVEEGRFLYGVGSEVRLLQTQLTLIQSLLHDAERRRHEDETSRNLITQIRDLAHRAEDAVLTYAVQVSSRRGQRIKQRLRRFSCILCECCSLHQVGTEISKIRSELERVHKRMSEYGLRNIIQGESSTANASDNQRWERLAFPFESIEDCFVGKEEELKRLVSLVTEDQHRVISLWGIGGIGKTTTARKVYNHTDVKHRFECYAWVCVTQQCQIRSVLEDVLMQLIRQKKEHVSSLSETELVAQLCEVQKSKRCMIVLDDLWRIDQWNGLKKAFLIEGLKSKIMLTTRNQDVANVGHAFEVGLLKKHDGWELLKKKAFKGDHIPAEFANHGEKLQQIGEEMVARCSYLPLVISSLGGVLSTRKSIEEWESVKKNINGKGIHSEEEVLRLSYDDLPYYLKPCFLYMGHFLVGKIIKVRDLLRQWIAQGMISHENHGEDETSMDIAEQYLRELASRCIVQIHVREGFQTQTTMTCKLHDVIRDLCLSLGRKEEFGLKIFDYENGRFSASLQKIPTTRHLAINFRAEMKLEVDHGDFTISNDIVRYVRSLAFNNMARRKRIEFPQTIFDIQKFKFLRELRFENFIFPQGKLPRGIGNLIHLRYLSVRACVLDELPSSIRNLAYLCTLDLFRSLNIRVPNVLKKMSRLKHLLLPFYESEKIGKYRLALDEGLDELETLIGFDSKVHELKAITRMTNLRYFVARVHDSESLSAIIDAITTNWKHLRFSALTITQDCKFTSEQAELAILKKVFECRKLHVLAIHVRIGKALMESTQIIASHLQDLTLGKCEIEDDPMGILGTLPCLRKLTLWKRSFVGEQMKCLATGFPCLEYLEMKGLSNLREWRVEEGAMPHLSEIHIIKCSRLHMVPDGLRFIGDLKKLMIVGMPEMKNRVASLQDGVEGEDFHKVRHVPCVLIFD